MSEPCTASVQMNLQTRVVAVYSMLAGSQTDSLFMMMMMMLHSFVSKGSRRATSIGIIKYILDRESVFFFQICKLSGPFDVYQTSVQCVSLKNLHIFYGISHKSKLFGVTDVMHRYCFMYNFPLFSFYTTTCNILLFYCQITWFC